MLLLCFTIFHTVALAHTNLYEGFKVPDLTTASSAFKDQCSIPNFKSMHHMPFAYPEIYQCDTIRLEDTGTAQDFLERFIVQRKPVKIVANDFSKLGWNMSAWSYLEMARRVGQQMVVVESIDPGKMFGQHSTKQLINFQTFLNLIVNYAHTEERTFYMNLQNPTHHTMRPPLSRMSDAFSVPHFFLSLPLSSMNMWFGNACKGGASSELHYDAKDNLYMLLKGSKTFRLYSPNDADNIYLNGNIQKVYPTGFISVDEIKDPLPGMEPHFSQVNPLEPDFEKFPKFKNAVQAECKLQAGDLLYLPTGWFHHVTSHEGISLAINMWSFYRKD